MMWIHAVDAAASALHQSDRAGDSNGYWRLRLEDEDADMLEMRD